MTDFGFKRHQLVPPDSIDLKKIRPFVLGEFIDNEDGTRSTERTIGLNIGGKEVLAPTLWMTPDGPVDLSRYPESITRAILDFERRGGKKFPRFDTPEQATEFAKSRSNSGGRFSGELSE